MRNKKIKNIVVGLDFSKPSKKAAAQARLIAKTTGASLTYVYAFDETLYATGGFEPLVKDLCQFHDKEVRRAYHLDQDAKLIVKPAKAFELIIKVAKRMDSPLIVVGRYGDGHPVFRMMLGSTTERLILNSPSPVLIHHGAVVNKFSSVLLPTDLSERSPRAKEVIKAMGLGALKFDYFYVQTPPVPMLDYENWQQVSAEWAKVDESKVKNFTKKHGKVLLGKGWVPVVDQIIKKAKKYDAVVVTPQHPKGFFKGLGRTALKIMRLSPGSVLMVP